MQKPTFRPIAPLDVDDQELDLINNRLGVPTMVRANTKPAVMTGRRQAVATASPHQKLTVRIPVYLADALKQKALDKKTTVRQLVLLALQRDGYDVQAVDLLPGAGGRD